MSSGTNKLRSGYDETMQEQPKEGFYFAQFVGPLEIVAVLADGTVMRMGQTGIRRWYEFRFHGSVPDLQQTDMLWAAKLELDHRRDAERTAMRLFNEGIQALAKAPNDILADIKFVAAPDELSYSNHGSPMTGEHAQDYSNGQRPRND